MHLPIEFELNQALSQLGTIFQKKVRFILRTFIVDMVVFIPLPSKHWLPS